MSFSRRDLILKSAWIATLAALGVTKLSTQTQSSLALENRGRCESSGVERWLLETGSDHVSDSVKKLVITSLSPH